MSIVKNNIEQYLLYGKKAVLTNSANIKMTRYIDRLDNSISILRYYDDKNSFYMSYYAEYVYIQLNAELKNKRIYYNDVINFNNLNSDDKFNAELSLDPSVLFMYDIIVFLSTKTSTLLNLHQEK